MTELFADQVALDGAGYVAVHDGPAVWSSRVVLVPRTRGVAVR